MRVVGHANRGQIETRYAEDLRKPGEEHLDEIVAINAHVHVEQMNDSSFAIIVESDRERACIMLGAKRASVSAWVAWREPKRRAVAAKASKAKRAVTPAASEAPSKHSLLPENDEAKG